MHIVYYKADLFLFSIELLIMKYCPFSTVWEMAVHMAVVLLCWRPRILCCPFSYEMSWMRSGTEFGQS